MLTTEWKKSSRSGNQGGACVETRLLGAGVQVRDTKLGEDSPILNASHSDWVAIIGDLKR
ncbi:DUF397 domain-containing protein [Glycomyces paridis]|uniref:DUF397 domain-containing protein n=1 Tax=Glycomyces paridis TaxID=2126555 RepID=A0A4S8P855_9ACTN|nr:DUF397 domain-containing protein [Glycomyces paridis]THV26417.1 DUF397 domain-containing protein [Glycomyces paridis]